MSFFPQFRTTENRPGCPMPDEVDRISDVASCQTYADLCTTTAASKARYTNAPEDISMARWFYNFGHGDSLMVQNSTTGELKLDYIGGCKALGSEQGKAKMWPSLRERLREQSFRFHSAQGSIQSGTQQAPTTVCRVLPNGKSKCV